MNREEGRGKRGHSSLVTRHSSLSMRTEGSVLMEAIVCLPLLLLLVSGIWQFTRIWEARFFTWLAAYNAARATLVYNPLDYAWKLEGASRQITDDSAMECRVEKEPDRWIFRERAGVAWLAAVNTLAWISQTDGTEEEWYVFPRFGRIPHSGRITEQVRIVSERDPGIVLANANPLTPPDLRYSAETGGVVRVSVEFKMPLILSIFDPSLMFPGGLENTTLSAFRGVEPDDAAARAARRLGRTFSLRETVVLPKPWSTEWYPLLSYDERRYLLDIENFATFGNRVGWWDNGTPELSAGGLGRATKIATSSEIQRKGL